MVRRADTDKMPGKHRLYMHCPGLCEDQLYTHLQQFGRVTDVYLPKGLDGQSKGYGFASFETPESLSAALAAGEEHAVQGRTVRVSRAGPRPALHLTSSGPLDSGRPPVASASSVPMIGGISRQRGGHSLVEPSHNNILLQSSGPASGSDSNTAGSGGLGDSSNLARPSISQGAGPRIYVGGVPNAVSETMVKKYFSNWGKVEDVYFPKERASGRRRPFCFVTFALQKAAENAVAQSSREIGGYPVASISMTADRIAHYQAVSGGGEEIQQMFQDVEPAHPFAVSLLSLFPQLAAIQSQQAGLPAMGADSITHGHKQGLPTVGVGSSLGAFTGLGGHMRSSLDDLALLPSAFSLAQPQFAHGPYSQQQLGQHQFGQQATQPQLSNIPALHVPTAPHDVHFMGSHMLQPQNSGVLQPHAQEALLLADMLRASDIVNPGVFPSSVHGMSRSPYNQQSHQHGYEATVGHHLQPGPQPQLGHYNSCPLDVHSAFRAQLDASPHAFQLAHNMGLSSAGHAQVPGLQTSQLNQEFNPTVGPRRPDDSRMNFG